jgi:glycine oxidase ThiO
MEVVIIGGGVIGLAIAWELARQDRGLRITVLERGEPCRGATWSAAGMLAPRAEGLTGSLLETSLQSLSLYPQWIADLQKQTGINCGYWCCGIIQPSNDRQNRAYLTADQLQQRQGGLGITEALWLPDDGQVDNRQLALALMAATRSLGVKVKSGTAVYHIVHQGDRVDYLETSAGKIRGDCFVLAVGAWTASLFPIPVIPRKGQMISVFDPHRSLQRIIYGEGIYIVPRQDGRIIIGATVEDVGFTEGNTAVGINHLLTGAIALYPAIADMTITESWWGFRPYLAGEELRLGKSDYDNLFLALGHYRNGILLAPQTAKVLTRHLLTP